MIGRFERDDGKGRKDKTGVELGKKAPKARLGRTTALHTLAALDVLGTHYALHRPHRGVVHRIRRRICSSLNLFVRRGGHARSSPYAMSPSWRIRRKTNTTRRRCRQPRCRNSRAAQFYRRAAQRSRTPACSPIFHRGSSPNHKGRCKWMMSSSTPVGTWPQNSRPASCGVINLHSHTPTKRTMNAHVRNQHARLAFGKTSCATGISKTMGTHQNRG